MSRAQAAEVIRSGKRFLLTCHRRPDGDALGSMLGLAAILERLGKTVVLYHCDPISDYLHFLLGGPDAFRGRIHLEPPAETFDAVIVTDTAAKSLLPPLPPRERSGPLIMLDHHAASDDAGDIIVRETDACATAEVVVRLMRDLGMQQVPTEAALPLYTAIVTDTGGFRYSGTSASTMRLAADLMDAGVDPWLVACNVFEGWHVDRVKLLSRVLADMQIFDDGTIALIEVTEALLNEYGLREEHIEGFVNYGRMVRGIEVAVMLIARSERLTKVSLRSRDRVDVAEVAQALGGGGHRAASGASIETDMAGARVRVLAAVRDGIAAAQKRPSLVSGITSLR